MLARLVRELPVGPYLYEPKWDGFRCLAFRDGDDVDLRSRHDRPLARYFPEIVTALRASSADRVALDGELILARGPDRPFDFAALMRRLHPSATRVERLATETPAAYVAFDLLALGQDDLRGHGFGERRHRLEAVLEDAAPPLHLTPVTRDVDAATRWFERFRGGGIDGIVAKREDLPYEPGRRTMTKVKHERTADCVIAGVRLFAGEPRISSLLLGLYDERDALRHVGVVTPLPQAMRRDLITELAPLAVDIGAHPWREGFSIGASPLGRLKGSASRWLPEMGLDWLPLQPERVVEVGFDQVDVDRFRHPARFRRWRPDRTAASCRLEQLATDPPGLEAIIAGEPAPAR